MHARVHNEYVPEFETPQEVLLHMRMHMHTCKCAGWARRTNKQNNKPRAEGLAAEPGACAAC